MRSRSITKPIKYPEKFKPLGRGLPRTRRPQLKIVKTPRAPKTADVAINPLERQAWPKGERFRDKKASLPERRVIWWLINKSGLEPGDFEFQPEYLGGRQLKGGLVCDFAMLTIMPGAVVIWEVEGETWHEAAWKQIKDRLRKATLLTLPGVEMVISLQERDINRSDPSRDAVCEDAMKLIERAA